MYCVVFNKLMLVDYMEHDTILGCLDGGGGRGCQWLVESPPKRMIYFNMYGDLLFSKKQNRVLDVGGGYSNLTERLIDRHNYTLIDIDPDIPVGIKADWLEYSITNDYDIIIANDIFPNVDQRLYIFISKFIPHCKEMRLSLTWFDFPKFYKTKRVDGDEILYMLAWDTTSMNSFLETVSIDIDDYCLDEVSIFPNGRRVCMVTIKGGLA